MTQENNELKVTHYNIIQVSSELKTYWSYFIDDELEEVSIVDCPKLVGSLCY